MTTQDQSNPIRFYAVYCSDGYIVTTYQHKTPRAANRLVAKLGTIGGKTYRVVEVRS